MEKNKVLIINEGNSENLGDQAINFVIHKLFEEHNIKCDWQSYSCHQKVETLKKVEKKTYYLKTKIANTCLFKHYFRLQWWNINNHHFKKYNDCKYDIILIGGGQLLNNSWLYPYLFYKWTTIFKECNLITFAIGLGAKFNFIDKRLLYKGLSNCKLRTVRDFNSKSYIQNQFNIDSLYIPDPVFKISDYIKVEKETNQAIILPVSYNHVYLKHQNKMSEIEYLNIWIKKINEYSSQYDKTIVSITDLVQDRKIHEDLKHHFRLHKNIVFIIPNDLQHLVSLIAASDKLYSGRMHALIIAYSYGVNCEVYPISKKLETFENEVILNKEKDIRFIKCKIEERTKDLLYNN